MIIDAPMLVRKLLVRGRCTRASFLLAAGLTGTFLDDRYSKPSFRKAVGITRHNHRA